MNIGMFAVVNNAGSKEGEQRTTWQSIVQESWCGGFLGHRKKVQVGRPRDMLARKSEGKTKEDRANFKVETLTE